MPEKNLDSPEKKQKELKIPRREWKRTLENAIQLNLFIGLLAHEMATSLKLTKTYIEPVVEKFSQKLWQIHEQSAGDENRVEKALINSLREEGIELKIVDDPQDENPSDTLETDQ